MSQALSRRNFFARTAAVAAGATVLSRLGRADDVPTVKESAHAAHGSGKMPFKISLAEWSLHKSLQKGEMTNLDFPKMAKEKFGIDGVEFVNQFFKDKAKDHDYLTQLKKVCEDNGVAPVLIMIDGEGALGDANEANRTKAVESHYKWVEAAKFLGCHSIRVNASTSGSFVEAMPKAADGLRRLCEFADPHGINVIVENHGGLSSNGAWLAGVMELVDHPRVGTLPDFGNFNIGGGKSYDKYKGVTQLMPYAKAVSAKSYDFDDKGNEKSIDYERMMGIVTGWGYDGFVGIEYEGGRLSEAEGILATKALMEKVRTTFTGHA